MCEVTWEKKLNFVVNQSNVRICEYINAVVTQIGYKLVSNRVCKILNYQMLQPYIRIW